LTLSVDHRLMGSIYVCVVTFSLGSNQYWHRYATAAMGSGLLVLHGLQIHANSPDTFDVATLLIELAALWIIVMIGNKWLSASVTNAVGTSDNIGAEDVDNERSADSRMKVAARAAGLWIWECDPQ